METTFKTSFKLTQREDSRVEEELINLTPMQILLIKCKCMFFFKSFFKRKKENPEPLPFV